MRFVGIDVSKNFLDVFIRPDGTYDRFEYNEEGIKKLIKKLRKVELIALEATGNLEKQVLHELVKAGLKVSCVNPRQIRDFAKSSGRLAKTDKVDASVIAHYAEVFKPREYVMASEDEQDMQELLSRRKQLVDMRTAEKNRIGPASKAMSKNIREHIKWLDSQIKEIDQQLNQFAKDSEQIKEKKALLKSIPSIGDVSSMTLILEVPELGKISSKKISALIGLAPINRDSGQMRGKMTIFGGRKSVRTALYMPVLNAIRNNPVIKDFYQRLIEKGKKHMVAITACMHKLLIIANAVIKTGKKWSLPEKFNQEVNKCNTIPELATV